MLTSAQKHALVRQAKALCRENSADLLFLTVFGSTLYGTKTPGKSDVDIRGIFLPSPASLALNTAPRSLHWTTGAENRRNTADDVDMDLWSVQHWLLKLLPAGDTGAMDVLFSPSHAACTLFTDPRLDAVFAHPRKLMDAENIRTYAEYSLGQAKKYGIKGTRIGVLKQVHRWLQTHCPVSAPDSRLRDILDDLTAACADGQFCFQTRVQDEPALELCGKIHVGGIRTMEFIGRVESEMQRYGARAMEAEKNQGIDFKALSHAVRALDQMEEILNTGTLVFPLATRETLMAVKQGKIPWQELEPAIVSRLEQIDLLQKTADFTGHADRCFAENQVLACYGIHPSPAPAIHHNNVFQTGFSVPPDTLALIQQKLVAAETAHGVKILYACESGSRGWGFASDDSDFDVRFIYVHEPDWYLGAASEEKRDVIELGIENTAVGELDINGWELRKALKLFRQSNPPLLEWLSSPLVYRECGMLALRLRAAAMTSASPIRTWHHYRSLMEKSRARYKTTRPTLKTWFYVMRPLLAMRWIERGNGMPPMRFDQLMDKVIETPELRNALDLLVEKKKQGAETDDFSPPPMVERFVENELHRLSAAPPQLTPEHHKADLDAIFRETLVEAWPAERKIGFGFHR